MNIPVLIGAVTSGFILAGLGELLLAVREIAVNTRQDKAQGNAYAMLRILAGLYSVLGWVVVVGSLAVYFYQAGRG